MHQLVQNNKRTSVSVHLHSSYKFGMERSSVYAGVVLVWQRVGRILPRPRPACRKRRLMAIPLLMYSLSTPSVGPI
jgi:hypothetical protein